MSRQPLRAVIYARNSKLKKSEQKLMTTRSVDEQLEESREECARQGWKIVQEFREPGRSASRYASKERPEYAETIKYVEAGNADVLVCWESSRAQRDIVAYIRLRDVCAKTGTLYSYKGRTYDLTRSDDRFTTGLDALLDERESDITRDRILRDVRANAIKGRPHGHVLYGYRREYDPDTGALLRQVLHADTSKIVKEAATRFLKGGEGNSLKAIAESFNSREIPSPRGKKWAWGNVRRMLLNPGYAGLRVHQGKIIGDADWEPILDRDRDKALEIHRRLVAKMTPNGEREYNGGQVRHMLSGIARCGKCDGRMYAKPARALRGELAYACENHCLSRKASYLEQYVEGWVVLACCIRPDGPELLGLEQEAGTTEDAAKELRELQARLDGFRDAAADGKVSEDGLARIEARLIPQIKEAQEAARNPGVPDVVYETVDMDSDVVRHRWRNERTLDEQRTILRTVLDIRVLPVGGGGKPFDPNAVEVIIKYRAARR